MSSFSSNSVCNTEIKNKRGSLTFELTTTALCDLNCTYCFEGVKSNPKKLQDLDLLAKRIREILDTDWFNENYIKAQISFWGGEPTLNYNYITKIINEFKDDERVWFQMYSNGYNIENMKKVVDNVDCSKFNIQISYDGRIINDHYRLTHTGKSSADLVLQTFKYLADKGISLHMKSTIPGTGIKYINETWDNFNELRNEYKDYKNVRINFAPTLDYAMMPSDEDKLKEVQIFREQVLKIAKKEIEFYKNNGHFLMSWFGGSNSKANCSAGLNMIAIDVDGNSYACHGVFYSKNKDKLKSSSIFDDDFINNIKEFNDSFETSVKNVPEACKKCVATTCIVCPVNTFNISKKESTKEKWEDRAVNGLCEFYQAFGEIDRSIQKYLNLK